MEGFDVGWFFMGLLFLAVGAGIVVKYQWIAHNVATGGINSYDRVKLFGLVVCGVGLMLMTNLHMVILRWLVNLVFVR